MGTLVGVMKIPLAGNLGRKPQHRQPGLALCYENGPTQKYYQIFFDYRRMPRSQVVALKLVRLPL